MELIDLQSRHGEEEIKRLSTDIKYGKHSQPTTPPEYSNSTGFPTSLSRPNRFSMSSFNPGMTTPRGSRSGSQVTSPPSSQSGYLPSKSMPGSRRNSDEEGDDFDNDTFTPLSPVTRNHNRMSMPVLGSGRPNENNNLPDLASVLGSIDTAAYLFGDEGRDHNPAASPNHKSYLQMNTTDDKFPILVRRSANGNGMELSASSAALDLALSQSPGPDGQSNGWPGHRHRQAQQSLPTNTFRKGSQVDEYEIGQANGSVETTPTKNNNGNRRSVDFNFGSPMNTVNSGSKRSSFASPSNNGVPKLQQSYSTNDVPTLKNGDAVNGSGVNTHAEQHLQNHNVTLGRYPQSALHNRHSRELSTGFKEQEYRSLQSGLHASAAPFGPSMTSSASTNGSSGSNGSTIGSPTLSQYSTATGATAPYYGYGMSMLNGAMAGMSLGGPQLGSPPTYNPNGMYTAGGVPPYYGAYTQYGPNGRIQDSQARVIQSRRMQSDANRFVNYDLKTMPPHEIYSLCKDQHGCRFLQKKLEERNAEYLQIIFDETAPHVVELMTDPFGNYLCQKLLEYTNDDQRNTLVRNAASSLVQIALNQHGTRALQKMIEFISTPEQIKMIMQALQDQVVDLIQDLNGNHVIQKCLNHLKAEDAQFIFDAVGHHCITVGTHRHGCCVLQRCIDHASGFQKVQLVRQITANAFHLVQDPFGNYVVQYILDLNDPGFTTPLCMSFQGKIAELSKQKFSSNVIEKCVRCADVTTKLMMIEEMMHPDELEKLMRDSYGNYVIQTALEFAPPDMCLHLIEAMRPILPGIRQTPYGRRIQGKVQERESRLAAYTGRSGHGTPHSTRSPETVAAFATQVPGTSGYPTPPMYTAAANYGSNIASPQPHRMSNPPLPSHLQNSVQNQTYQQYGMASAMPGNFF
ncbi:ARM repeat-containing protein [Lentithecium fluviatile CBS 122367]|uniref:ARM repeat-containing protein n=1 Tax=Lentithecium fluviatile CBS 122367 TaxID=1168545 RepID=A0A6G1JDS8_9PLEO|nr:ARM repeat-containing protein [Lentithecium fluviatile CBS 122367]